MWKRTGTQPTPCLYNHLNLDASIDDSKRKKIGNDKKMKSNWNKIHTSPTLCDNRCIKFFAPHFSWIITMGIGFITSPSLFDSLSAIFSAKKTRQIAHFFQMHINYWYIFGFSLVLFPTFYNWKEHFPWVMWQQQQKIEYKKNMSMRFMDPLFFWFEKMAANYIA